MTDQPIHDLSDFLLRANSTLQNEYERIQRRVREDPGTAGDQCEENWAEFFRAWLPKAYTVVTKGRIIGVDGRMTPQIDLLVLKPSYPAALVSTKAYLAAGVAAAFECKVTLRPEHIRNAVKTCVIVKDLFQARTGTPQKELHSPIVYGLLSHSHCWKTETSKPVDNVNSQLNTVVPLEVRHPRYLLDLLCVADVGIWSNQVTTLLLSQQPTWVQGRPVHDLSTRTVASGFVASTSEHNESSTRFSPVSTLLWTVFQKMAREDASMRDLAEYYRHVGAANGSGGLFHWNPDLVYSPNVIARLRAQDPFVGSIGIDNEWSAAFF